MILFALLVLAYGHSPLQPSQAPQVPCVHTVPRTDPGWDGTIVPRQRSCNASATPTPFLGGNP